MSTVYSKPFLSSLERTLTFEGVYSDDVVDRGGATKYGITLSTWLKNGDGETLLGDINLDQAKSIYWRLYWVNAGLDSLDKSGVPDILLRDVFDACVNHGVKAGSKMLQMAYNIVRYDDSVLLKQDGVLGPITRVALFRFCFREDNVVSLLGAFRTERGRYYEAILAKDPSQRKFVRGWFKRLV